MEKSKNDIPEPDGRGIIMLITAAILATVVATVVTLLLSSWIDLNRVGTITMFLIVFAVTGVATYFFAALRNALIKFEIDY